MFCEYTSSDELETLNSGPGSEEEVVKLKILKIDWSKKNCC